MEDIKKEARINLFAEFDDVGDNKTWEVVEDENGNKVLGRVSASAKDVSVKEALEAGGAWAYKEGDNIYIDTGDTMLHQATIIDRRANLKYGIVCQGSSIIHEIDGADIIDVDENLF